MSHPAPGLRVAVTVEQCWHTVPGGIARSTTELLRALSERGDLDLVGVSARHPRPPAADLAPPVTISSFPVPRRALYGAWQWLGAPAIERATGPVDVVHDLGYVVPPSKAPLVATVHDLSFLSFPEHYTRPSLAVLRRGLHLARRRARLVMCPSQATAEACRNAGIDGDRVRVVPWGVTVRTVREVDARAALSRHGLTQPYVLFCGTVEPRKNLPRVVRAFRDLDRRDVDLVLVGPRGWKESVDTDLAALGERAKVLGYVPRGELDALYANAAVVVYPSLAEGFGLPVLEAMAHGAAVVTSSGTATEETAGDAAMLVEPLDTGAISGAIAMLLDDRELAARLGLAARERAGSFSWTRSAALAAEVYAEAAGRS